MARAAHTPDVETFKSHPVAAPYALDEGPGRHRIGLITLATDYVIERDFMNMRPGDDVAIYSTRLRNVNPCTVENLRSMAPQITEAASLILPEGRLGSEPAVQSDQRE